MMEPDCSNQALLPAARRPSLHISERPARSAGGAIDISLLLPRDTTRGSIEILDEIIAQLSHGANQRNPIEVPRLRIKEHRGLHNCLRCVAGGSFEPR